jgi:3'-5' exoribonuclease 1
MNISGIKNNLLIVDLEATCWEKNKRKTLEMETIEIGALKVNLNDINNVDEFDCFIRPVRNPILSEFCTTLTSIKQENVDSAEIFPVVFPKFLEWVGDAEKISFCSWSKYDKWQFQQDCTYHKIKYPFTNNHFDIKALFTKTQNGKRYGVGRALRLLGMKFEGTRHRGIDDTRNIWRIFKRMILAGEEQMRLEL